MWSHWTAWHYKLPVRSFISSRNEIRRRRKTMASEYVFFSGPSSTLRYLISNWLISGTPLQPKRRKVKFSHMECWLKKNKGWLCVYRGIVWYHFQCGLFWVGAFNAPPPPWVMGRENRPLTKGLRQQFKLVQDTRIFLLHINHGINSISY